MIAQSLFIRHYFSFVLSRLLCILYLSCSAMHTYAENQTFIFNKE